MKSNPLHNAVLLLCAVWLWTGLNARGADCASLTINALDSGWYDANGYHAANNESYFCGDSSASPGVQPLRNWFAFNIPMLTQPVASAWLRIYTFDLSFTDSETFELRHVGTPVATLRAGGSGLTGIYADLADGAVYGSRTFLNGDRYQFVTISLDAAFVSSLTAASGSTLALGGRVISLDGVPFNNEYLFGNFVPPGTNGSTYAQLIVNYTNANPQTIVQEPASLALLAGDTASLQVRVCGGGTPAYQWQRGDTNLPGATNPFLQLPNAQPADSGAYRVLVTSAQNTVTSAVATLTITNGFAPTGSIYFNYGQSPTLAGSTVGFCSSISAVPAPSFQWQRNGANLPAENGSCYSLNSVQTNQAGSYRLIASNAYGSFTSAPISLVVTQAAPTGEIYSYSQLPAPAGSTAVFCSSIAGGPTPNLQWQFNGANLPGEIYSCLYVYNLQSNNAGLYRLVASNVAGVFTSAPINLAVSYFAPTGTLYLSSGQSPAPAGSFVEFCAGISAAPFPYLQWQFNGVNLPGQSNACLYIYNVSSNQAGLYRLVMSNVVGVFTSAPIALAVNYFAPAGTIFSANGPSSMPAGSTAGFCSTISAAPPAAYQWQFNGVNLPGQSNACLYISNFSSNQAGLYRLVASNLVGVFTSAPVAMAVYYEAPFGSITPSGVLPPVVAGSDLHLYSSIYGAPLPNYRWQFNGVNLPGQTGQYLDLFNVQTNQSGNYRLIASNVAGSFTSAVAVVSVIHTPPTPIIYLNSGHTPTTVGSSLSLCSYVYGAPTPTRQWQFKGVNLPGETNECLYLSNLQTNQSGGYTFVASNALGVVTSAVVAISIVDPAPVLAYFSGAPPFAVGGSVGLCAEVSPPEPATFQWRFNGTNVPGATNVCLYLLAYPGNAGDYSVVAITPTSGLVTSPPVSLTVYYAPPMQAIVQIGANIGASPLEGGSVTLSGYYSGSPSFIQWRLNGVDLPGENQTYLSLLGVTTNQSGQYSFTAANLGGMTTSTVVTLTVVQQPPGFVTHPFDQTVVEGTTARLSGSAIAGPPPAYFLQHDGTNVAVPFTYPLNCSYCAGGFSLIDTTLEDAGSYRIIASNFLGMATSAVVALTVTPAGPLDRWTQRNPLPQSQPLLAVAHGTNQFVAVGERGTILTSSDGSNWALQNRRADVPFNGVVYGNGLFVAVGASGTILSSTDGTNWSYRYTAAGTFLNAVTYGNGRFIAVGNAPGAPTLIMHSTDGINWAQISFNNFLAQQCVAYGDGRFVAAGTTAIIVSTNGTNWALALGLGKQFESIIYAAGQYVAVGDDGSILVSTDAAFWSPRAPVTTRRLLGVTYGLGRFVAAGARGTMLTSTDAITWTAVTSGTPDRLETIDFSRGTFVAAGENGTIITSTNGTSWTKQNFGVTRDLDGMYAANGTLVVVGKGGTILTSRDGVHYTSQNAGVTNDLHGVTWGGGLWVAVGEPGIVLTSSNAVNWITRASGIASSLKGVTYADGQWIAVGTQGAIVRSTDGVNWATTFTNPAYDLNDVAHGNGLFLIAGDGPGNANGSVFQSSDGMAWTLVNFFAGANLRGITFADNLFLFAANDGIVFTTSNALSFNYTLPLGTSIEGANLRAVAREQGLWIAVGNNGAISTSPDLVTWTSRASRTFENQHQVALLDGHLVVIGNRGGVLQSGRFVTDLEPPVFVAGTGFRLRFKGVIDRTYQVEASTDLANWTNVATFVNPSEHTEFTDTNALQLPLRFYRLVEP